MKKTTKNYNWFIILFIAILYIPLISFFIPINLGSNPLKEGQLKEDGLKSALNGDFQREVETFLNDRVFLHNQMIWLKTNIDLLSGRKETNGVYITDKMLIEKPNLPTKKDCDKVSTLIGDFFKKTQKKNFLMIFPTSAQINKAYLPATAPKTDETYLIGLVAQNLPKDTIQLDTKTPLATTKGRKSYYLTDSRLTSYGAFSVYNYNIKHMGLASAALSEFDIQYGTKDYYGNLYLRTFYTGIQPDKVNLYNYNTHKLDVNVDIYDKEKYGKRNGLFDVSYLTSNDSIASLAGESAAVKIYNSNAIDGKNLVVFADDNFDPFLQFLTIHYSKITVVDLPRLTPEFCSLIDIENADQILFSYGIETVTNSEEFENLEMILK